MSYDPYDYGSEAPSPAAATSARQRVQAPGVALIVVGILNLLLALVQVLGTIWIAVMPATKIEEICQEAEDSGLLPKGFTEKFKEQQQQQGRTAEETKIQTVIQNIIGSILMVATAILPLLGGIRMRALRSYALSVVGAISAAIPCLSCGGACCFGEIIGIWALVVLLNSDVKSAFQ